MGVDVVEPLEVGVFTDPALVGVDESVSAASTLFRKSAAVCSGDEFVVAPTVFCRSVSLAFAEICTEPELVVLPSESSAFCRKSSRLCAASLGADPVLAAAGVVVSVAGVADPLAATTGVVVVVAGRLVGSVRCV